MLPSGTFLKDKLHDHNHMRSILFNMLAFVVEINPPHPDAIERIIGEFGDLDAAPPHKKYATGIVLSVLIASGVDVSVYVGVLAAIIEELIASDFRFREVDAPLVRSAPATIDPSAEVDFERQTNIITDDESNLLEGGIDFF
jgi:hypothetical protein